MKVKAFIIRLFSFLLSAKGQSAFFDVQYLAVNDQISLPVVESLQKTLQLPEQ